MFVRLWQLLPRQVFTYIDAEVFAAVDSIKQMSVQFVRGILPEALVSADSNDCAFFWL